MTVAPYIQNIFTGFYPTKKVVVADPLKPALRPSQLAAFKALKNKRLTILDAPTGWGKSLVIIFLIAWKLLLNKKLRCIISVPQTVIGRNFIKGRDKTGDRDFLLKLPGMKGEHPWIVDNDLCHYRAEDTIDTLIEFLSGKVSTLFGRRILVCTHATLTLAYDRLQETKQMGLLKNLLVWIDEGHHVCNAQVKDSDEIVSNRLGAFVTDCIKQGNSVNLATATYSRGDRLHIIPDKVRSKFTPFYMPWDRYLEKEAPIESFDFNLVFGDPFKSLDYLLKENKVTTIYLARRSCRHAIHHKDYEVASILKTLAKGKRIKQDGPVLIAGGRRVLDLVSTNTQAKGKEYLNSDNAKVDVIIALEMCKEGFDWKPMERIIILGERQPCPEMVQMIGRLFRPYEGKSRVSVYQLLPAVVKNKSDKVLEENAQSAVNVITSAMLYEDIFTPRILTPGEPKRTDRYGPGLPKVPSSLLTVELFKDFLSVATKDYDETWRHMRPVLKRHGIEKAIWKPVYDRLWKCCAVVSRRAMGLRFDVPFDVLKHTELQEGIVKLMTGALGACDLKAFREFVDRTYRTPEEWVPIAEDLAKKHGGVLPNCMWLIENGYSALDQAMRNYPELFAGFNQKNKKGKTLKEHLQDARRLTKNNEGLLPNYAWLRDNGYGSLNAAIRFYPSEFTNFKQAVVFKTVTEHIHDAEQLAKKQDGILPNSKWLSKNGHSKLVSAMQNHPEEFAHIEQVKIFKTVAEHVQDAEQLAKANGGVLPNPSKLPVALRSAMQGHCGAFSHLEQTKKFKSHEDHVRNARRLTKENGGKLPSYQSLIDGGFNGLAQHIRIYPNDFARFKQEYRGGKSLDEHVRDARRLAKDNGGTLPCCGWLSNNGYHGLSQAIRKTPAFFTEIKQEILKGKSAAEHAKDARRLAKENGGRLPCGNWLNKNGYSGLVTAMKKQPDKFVGIKQEDGNQLQSKQRLEKHVQVAEQLAVRHGGTLPNPKWLETNGFRTLTRAMSKNPNLFAHISQVRIK